MRRLLVMAALLGACGGSDDDDGGAVDAGVDGSGAACLVPSSYGALGARTGTTSQGATTLTVVLDQGPPRDSFFLRLNTGKGVFANGLATGTYTIAGADAGANTCGLCVNIIADIVAMQGPTKLYLATSGSVTLTSTSPPAGSLSNVGLVEVDLAGNPVAGCTTTIGSMSFSM